GTCHIHWVTPGLVREGRGPVGRGAHERGDACVALVARIDHVHRGREAGSGDSPNGVGSPRHHPGQLRALDWVETREHPRGDLPAPASGRMPDAEAHAGKIWGAEALDDAANAVVARVSTAQLEAYVAPRQVELVVNDEDVRRGGLEEGRRG